MKKIFTLLMALVVVLSATAEDIVLKFGDNKPVFEYDESYEMWHFMCTANGNAYSINLYYYADKENPFGSFDSSDLNINVSRISNFSFSSNYDIEDGSFRFDLNEEGTRYTFSANLIGFDDNTYVCQGEWDYEPTGLNSVKQDNAMNNNRKYIENGRLVILKNGVKYTTAGTVIK